MHPLNESKNSTILPLPIALVLVCFGLFPGAQAVVPPPAVPYDFNNDAHSDYLLYNSSTRQTAVWHLNNNVFIGGAYGPTIPVGWRVIDVADFNRDGNNDYALFNSSTRQTAIWYLSGVNGVTLIASAWGPRLPNGWALVATGEFNHDLKPDYVIFNATTRRTAIWYLSNNVFIGGAFGPTLPGGWSLVGTPDFGGYPGSDLLLQARMGQTVFWFLHGTAVFAAAYGPTIATGYDLVGTTDFNRDGYPDYPDYLLFNPSTRQTVIWYLHQGIPNGTAFGPTLPAGWTVAAP